MAWLFFFSFFSHSVPAFRLRLVFEFCGVLNSTSLLVWLIEPEMWNWHFFVYCHFNKTICYDRRNQRVRICSQTGHCYNVALWPVPLCVGVHLLFTVCSQRTKTTTMRGRPNWEPFTLLDFKGAHLFLAAKHLIYLLLSLARLNLDSVALKYSIQPI